jgi:hypothetical protein
VGGKWGEEIKGSFEMNLEINGQTIVEQLKGRDPYIEKNVMCKVHPWVAHVIFSSSKIFCYHISLLPTQMNVSFIRTRVSNLLCSVLFSAPKMPGML